MNTYDNTISKKEHDFRKKDQDNTASSRTKKASKLSPIERLVISMKNKIGVNISTEESSRIINSIPTEKDSEETAKSLIEALNRKKIKHPELNIDEKVALAYATKGLKVIDAGIESQKNKLNMEKNKPNIKDDNYEGFLEKTYKVYDKIFNELYDNHSAQFAGVSSKLTEKYGRLSEIYDIIYNLKDEIAKLEVHRIRCNELPKLTAKKERQIIDEAIAETTKRLSEAKAIRNEREYHHQMGVIEFAKSLGAELPEKVRGYIAEYEANLREYFTPPNMIKAREQGIERLQEYRKTFITARENCEHVLLMTEVRDAMRFTNEVLINESKKHDEQLNEINRNMKDIQIKQDVINTLVANHNGQNKNIDTEEKDIVFPSVPQHAIEPSSSVALEETPRHKSKLRRKAAILDN